MASTESQTVRDMYLSWTAARIKGEQPDNESWGNLTAEPGGVDYLEFEIGGMRAMWAAPAQRDDDRVLLIGHPGCCLDRRRGRAELLLALVGGPIKDQPLPAVVRCREAATGRSPG